MSSQINKRLLSLAEAAEYIGQSPHTLRKRLLSGELPYFQLKKHGKLYLTVEALDQFIDQHTHSHRPQARA